MYLPFFSTSKSQISSKTSKSRFYHCLDRRKILPRNRRIGLRIDCPRFSHSRKKYIVIIISIYNANLVLYCIIEQFRQEKESSTLRNTSGKQVEDTTNGWKFYLSNAMQVRFKHASAMRQRPILLYIRWLAFQSSKYKVIIQSCTGGTKLCMYVFMLGVGCSTVISYLFSRNYTVTIRS